MKISKQPWPLISTHGIRERVDTNPDYQRPPVWTRSQKQLLVDSMLRNYDVPKLYWRRLSTNPDKYEVIDGQQRLRAVWEFFAGGYGLPANADPVDGHSIAGKKYKGLPDELRIRFDTYALDVVLVDDAKGDEVREMFLRLQNGTTLRAQEKRNAYPGAMRDFVRKLASHPFFGSVAFANSRYTHDLVAAQFVCLEIAGGPTNVKNRELNNMYKDNKQFDTACKAAAGVRRTLDLLEKVFPVKTPELTRYNVIALYCVCAELLSGYVRSEFTPLLHGWFIDFEGRRRKQAQLSEDEAEPEWVAYKEKISHSTDSEDSIRARMDFLLRDLLTKHPSLPLTDGQRIFTPQQRLAVYRRDSGECQLRVSCGGEKVRWDMWHCDHRIPWSKGGRTTVENGQVACVACNLAKGSSVA